MDRECEIQAPSSPKNLRGTLRHNLKLEHCGELWHCFTSWQAMDGNRATSKAYPNMLPCLQITVSRRCVLLVMLDKGKPSERGASIPLMILADSTLAHRSEVGLGMLVFQSVSRSSSRQDSSRTCNRRSNNEDIGMPSMFLDKRPASIRVVCNRSDRQKDTE
ncbi:hypothetical protein EDD17DRAFT_1616635 [Pisolithus thermaeus]|nr:hypothetical protein EDD17DRAFT_1616635 [Pisolithus thermaeus]